MNEWLAISSKKRRELPLEQANIYKKRKLYNPSPPPEQTPLAVPLVGRFRRGEERREVCEREKRAGKVKRREPRGGNERIENL